MAPEKLLASFFQAPKRLRATENFSGKTEVSTEMGAVNLRLPSTIVDLESPSENFESAQSNDATLVSQKECSGFCQQLIKEGREEEEGLNEDQKIRMELNKAIACAKRNLRVCEERVGESRAKGIACPNLADLLVEQSWLNVLQEEFQKPYMEKLCQFVMKEANGNVPIYPPPAQVFHAFNSCPLDKVKVVIIGQDPYHGPGQAMGLCFSVPKGVKIPSSLLNIYKEIQQDVGCKIPSHGNLEKWVHQGVLLLNTVLTVREHQANAHAKKGWEPFTDAAIRLVSQQRSGIVFLLWGNAAQEKVRLVNSNGHYILKAAHPSGLSAHKGFFNCRHFSQTNELLKRSGRLPIDWQI
ncbi:hypothetical protein O6H91_15G070700 [Diphasiastrum complanatum]|nr:hypothetical protein O6H91_15G070700 [Diphasiastrum complanatum]